MLTTSCNTISKGKVESKVEDTITVSATPKKVLLHSSVTHWNELYDTLQKVELPLALTDDKWRGQILHFYKKLKQYSIPPSFPVTIVSENENYIGVIIIVDELPVLVTYDSERNPIDELFIFDDYGMDPTKSISEYALINADLTINLVDSILTYRIDENEIQIMETQEFSRTVNNYRIDDKGRFIKED